MDTLNLWIVRIGVMGLIPMLFVLGEPTDSSWAAALGNGYCLGLMSGAAVWGLYSALRNQSGWQLGTVLDAVLGAFSVLILGAFALLVLSAMTMAVATGDLKPSGHSVIAGGVLGMLVVWSTRHCFADLAPCPSQAR